MGEIGAADIQGFLSRLASAGCWGAEKNGPQAIGRSRGGLTTKIHALVDALGNPVRWRLTAQLVNDIVEAESPRATRNSMIATAPC